VTKPVVVTVWPTSGLVLPVPWISWIGVVGVGPGSPGSVPP